MGFKLQRTVIPATRATVVTALTSIVISNGPTSGFIPVDDGQFICRLSNDLGFTTFQVVQGGIYPLDVAEVSIANTRNGVLIYPL